MNKSISFLFAGILIGIAISTAGFALYVRQSQSGDSTEQQQIILKLGHGLDQSHPVHLAMEELRDHLEILSEGTMTIDIYASGVLGSETQAIEQLQQGELAMTKTSAAAMEAYVPDMAVFSLPYIFRNHEHYWSVLMNPLGREMLEKGRDRKLIGLCYYDAGSRNFYTIDRPVHTPEDLKGLKIRVMNSATSLAMVEALGGSPTPLAWGDLYSALAQGTVDGAENNIPSYVSSRHYEVAKYFTHDAHTRIPDILLIGTETWDTLTLIQQEWLKSAANESSRFQRKLWDDRTKEDKLAAEEAGVTFIEADESLFEAKVQPLLKEYEGTSIGDLLERIEDIQ